MDTKPVEILLVEDNEGDVGLVEEVFEDAKIRNTLHVAEDGEEAMLFLNKEKPFNQSTHSRYNIIRLKLATKRWTRSS